MHATTSGHVCAVEKMAFLVSGKTLCSKHRSEQQANTPGYQERGRMPHSKIKPSLLFSMAKKKNPGQKNEKTSEEKWKCLRPRLIGAHDDLGAPDSCAHPA
jgi:hypothetical protein